VTRREFLLRLSALGGGISAASAFGTLAAMPDTAAPLDIVVVGAGLAGLCAAYELEKRGHRVTILEADQRHVGGRTRTLRFADGLYGEAGAMRIPTRHDVTRHYIGEFKLPLRKFVLSNPQAYYYLRGERQRIGDVAKLNRLYAMRDDERNKSPEDMWAQSVGKTTAALTPQERRELTGVTLTSDRVRLLDQTSLQQIFEAAGLSDEAIEFLSVTQGQETELTTAATETIREEFLEVWSQGFDEIVGGTDRLASAFASKLRSKPKLGCEVVRLTQQLDRSARRRSIVNAALKSVRKAISSCVRCRFPY
jgi:monoamine oxidase